MIISPGLIIILFIVALVVILLAIGFPLFLIFSWVFELTPEGLKREKDVRREASITKATGKTLDRAKGMIMRAKGVGEEEAYAMLRKTAMSQNRKVIDVAQALLTASDLLT